MSASQQKKTRQQQREEGVEKHQVAEKKAMAKAKKTKTAGVIVAAAAVLLVIAIILFSSNLFYQNFSAVTIGTEKYTAAEVNFFYKSGYYGFVNQYGDYLQYVGLDTTKSLKSQQYGEDQTWADFFKETAISNMTKITTLWSEAKAADFQLDETTQANLDAELEAIKNINVGSDFTSPDRFLAANYGRGLDVETVSALITKEYISKAYETEKRASFTYTAAELKAEYAGDKDNYDTYSYLLSSVSGAADEEKNLTAEDAMAAAKKTADSLIVDVETAEDFKAKALAVTGTEVQDSKSQGSNVSETYAEWMKDASRKEGDMTVMASESAHYAIYFIGRSDNMEKTASVRHILVKAAAGEDGTITDEAKAAAKLKADNLLKEWKDGDHTEDSFAALATANSEDGGSNANGGLYESFPKDQMVEAFDSWSFNSARKPGDTTVVFNEGSYTGYHVIYYVGQGDMYSNVLAETKLRAAAYTEWETGVLGESKASTGFTMMLVK